MRLEKQPSLPLHTLLEREIVREKGLVGSARKCLEFKQDEFWGRYRRIRLSPCGIRLAPPGRSVPLREGRDLGRVFAQSHYRFDRFRGYPIFKGALRLGIEHPEIYEMQVRAIVEAAMELTEAGLNARPKIMIPLVGHVNELREIEPVA